MNLSENQLIDAMNDIKWLKDKVAELEKRLEVRNKDKIQYLTFAQKFVELENKKVCCEQDNGCSRLKAIIERIDKLFKTVHGIAPDEVDNLQERVEKLEGYKTL